MASHEFLTTRYDMETGAWDPENPDTPLEMLVVMTNSSLGGTNAEQFDNYDDITTPDEFDGAGYTGGWGGASRQPVTIEMEKDIGNNRIIWRLYPTSGSWGDEISFGYQASGTRDIKGFLIKEEGTSDETDARNVLFLELATTLDPDGAELIVLPDSTSVHYISTRA